MDNGEVRLGIWILPPLFTSRRQKRYVSPLILSTPLLLIVSTRVEALQEMLLHPVQVSRGVGCGLALDFMFVMRMLSFEAFGPVRSTGCRSSGSLRDPRVYPAHCVKLAPILGVLPGPALTSPHTVALFLIVTVPFDRTCPVTVALFWRSTESRTDSTAPGGKIGLPVDALIVSAAR